MEKNEIIKNVKIVNITWSFYFSKKKPISKAMFATIIVLIYIYIYIDTHTPVSRYF